jgi:hypothetical protein
MRAVVQGLSAGLALAVLAGGAWAQDRGAQVRAYLEYGMAAHESAGYARERTTPDLVVPIRLDRPYLWSVYLREGVNYRVYAACDDACSDLDMEIFAADGHFLERDVGRDDTPFVQVTPERTGRHYVRIWLYACAEEPCHIAARLVSGGQPVLRNSDPGAGSDTAP